MPILLEKSEYPVLLAGLYPAEIKDIELADGLYGQQLQFTLQVLQDSGATLRGWCSAKYSAKSSLLEWTKAALGRAPDPFDSEELIGKRVTLKVDIRQREDGSEVNRVVGLLPYAASGPG